MLRRERVFKPSDVYSYGVLLFELMTQLVPFSDIVPIMLPAMIIEGKVGDCHFNRFPMPLWHMGGFVVSIT